MLFIIYEKGKKKSPGCITITSQPILDTKRKRNEIQTNTRKTKQTHEKHTDQLFFLQARCLQCLKDLKHEDEMQGKTSPRRINHKAAQSKSNTESTAF